MLKAALAGALLLFASGVQSGLICPESAHAGHPHQAGMPTHHQSHGHHESGHQSEAPVCCWAVATCTSPAVPVLRTAALDLEQPSRHITSTVVNHPRSVAFAPETPPPKA